MTTTRANVLERIFEAVENYGTLNEYEEKSKLCGYELNTYTSNGVNQVIFLDFRDNGKDPKKAQDFLEVLEERISSIDIDEEIDLHRNDERFKRNFSIRQALEDFEDWKEEMEYMVIQAKKVNQ